MDSILLLLDSSDLSSAPSQNPRSVVLLGHEARLIVSVQQWWYDYNYDDEDSVMNEIDELYSYVEMPQVAENLKAWKGSFPGGTPDTTESLHSC